MKSLQRVIPHTMMGIAKIEAQIHSWMTYRPRCGTMKMLMVLAIKKQSVWFDQVPDTRRFPPLAGNVEVDVAVIGGGVAGVMAAYNLVERGLSVALLEKNHIATGDSGLTTGFLTRVPDASFAELQKCYGAEFVERIFEAAGKTQTWIFELIAKNSLDAGFTSCPSFYGSYHVNDPILAREFGVLEKIPAAHARRVAQAEIPGLPFAEAIEFRDEGKCHLRKLLFALLEKGVQKKLRIFEETEVVAIEAMGDRVMVKTSSATLTAKKVIVAMGNPASLFPELASLVVPKISYVAAIHNASAVIPNNLFWDTLDPYFYYRKVDDHTMIVGGCDIDADKIGTQDALQKITLFAQEHFGDKAEVSHFWSGSILHTSDGLPFVFEHPHYSGKVFCATGFGGNGLVFGTLAGRILANFGAGEKNEYASLFALSRTDAKIPVPVKKVIASTVSQFQKFAALVEFEGRKCLAKTIAGVSVVVFKIGGEFHALANTCSHAGGPLCDGELEESGVVTCPLHGARFDVKTGEVKGPPAVRAQQKYEVRLNGTDIEVKVENRGTVAQISVVKKPTHWNSLLKFSVFALAFWLAEFALQYFWLTKNDLSLSLVRGSALSGATFFGLALFSSVIFKWKPRLAVHWRIRRYLGVAGFVFAALHVFAVYHFIYNYNVAAVYWSFNPFKNPVIFASVAFPILFVMAATSTDWAMNKLTPKVWKFIHRFVYLAYWGVIFHFLLINPAAIKNPPGYFLMTVTAATLFGELFWFIKIAGKKRFLSLGAVVGFAIILLYLVTGWLAIRAGVWGK